MYYGNRYVFKQGSCTLFVHFVGLAYQGKDIVFRFIIEYSGLRDFGPGGNNRSNFIREFLKDDILACVET